MLLSRLMTHKLMAPLVTEEDVKFAQRMNFSNLKSAAPIDVQLEDIQGPQEENLGYEEVCEVWDDKNCKYSSNVLEVDLEDNLRDLKAFEKAQETGLLISYCCPSFQNC